MFHPYAIDVLILPASVIFLFAAAVSFRVTHMPVASLVIAFIKAGIFLIYFGFFFDGTFTFKDDLTYLRQGRYLSTINVDSLLDVQDFWYAGFSITGSVHIVYSIMNLFSFILFGEGYYAPVACNILFTILVAWMGLRLAEREFGFRGVWGILFFIFMMLFPDTLAWSSLLNLKDIAVLLLHVILMYGFSIFLQRRFVLSMMVIGSSMLVLLFLRFYVPALFSIAFFVSILISLRGKHRIILLILGTAVCAVFAVILEKYISILGSIELLFQYVNNPVWGFVRFLLTPIPLNSEGPYQFLEIPAVVHWTMFPVLVLGVLVVTQIRTPFARFFIIYFFVFVAFYAVVDLLQGPRHRVQLHFALAVFEFIGMCALIPNVRLRWGTFKRQERPPELGHSRRHADGGAPSGHSATSP